MKALLGNRVLVIPENNEQVRDSGFVVTTNKDDQSVKRGTVIAVGKGEDIQKDPLFTHFDGETTIQYQYGTRIEVDGSMMEFVRYEDVILVE